nr:hypothetical protein [Tanacetum cinerariifolium]
MYFDKPEADFQPQHYFTPQLSPSQRSMCSGSVNHNLDEARPPASPQQVPGAATNNVWPGIDPNHNLESLDRLPGS